MLLVGGFIHNYLFIYVFFKAGNQIQQRDERITKLNVDSLDC